MNSFVADVSNRPHPTHTGKTDKILKVKLEIWFCLNKLLIGSDLLS